MMDETKLVLFFLQILHYRDDLEEELFQNLKLSTNSPINSSDASKLYGQKVHSELIKNTVHILEEIGVLIKQDKSYTINEERLKYFRTLVNVAKSARNYKWPSNRPKPFLYISPPTLITTELSGDIDDISNLLTNLVRSATTSITIMSPFTNKEGLRSILSPLKACTNNPNIALYLTANEEDINMIFNQVKRQIPQNMLEDFKIYFCSTDLIEENNLPHAKLLIIDSKKGYLGSANFTKQGLTSRFEVGVELDEQQSKTVEKLFTILISNGIFGPYTGNSNSSSVR